MFPPSCGQFWLKVPGESISFVSNRYAKLHTSAMSEDALPAPEWPPINDGTLSAFQFPPTGAILRRSVFGEADPSAKVDLSTQASLAIFANATGIPEEANQFAKSIGAESADDLFHIPRDIWDKLTRETLLTRKSQSETGEELNEERLLTGVEVGKLNKGRDALNLAANAELEGASRSRTLTQQPSSPRRPAFANEGDVTVKLCHIIDDTLSGSVVKIDTTSWSIMAKNFREKYGALPKRDQEPSIEQVSGLQQLLTSRSAPYVDFSVWTPYARRAMRRLSHEATYWDPITGKMISNSRKGPGSFDAWSKGWAVFKNSMLYLEEATVAALDGYRDHVQEIAQTYPSCWFIIYNADVRCRSEQLEHILRDASASVLTAEEAGQKAALIGFDDSKPWDYVFKQTVSETNSTQQAFWNREVHIKCGQYLNRTASFASIMGDGTTLQAPTGKGKRGAPKGEGEGAPPGKKPYNPYGRARDRRSPGPSSYNSGKGKGQGQGSQQNGAQQWGDHNNGSSWGYQNNNNNWQNQSGGRGWPQGGKGDKGDKGNKGGKGDKGKTSKGGKGDKGNKGGKGGNKG